VILDKNGKNLGKIILRRFGDKINVENFGLKDNVFNVTVAVFRGDNKDSVYKRTFYIPITYLKKDD